jgi:hypothetical protein
VTGCGLVGGRSGASKPDALAQVLAITSCTPPQCIPTADVQSQVGFLPWEPTLLPPGYALYARNLVVPQITDAVRERIARESGTALDATPRFAVGGMVLIEYRFQKSPFTPAVVLRESPLPGLAALDLSQQGSCGEQLNLTHGPAIYGFGSLTTTPPSDPTIGRWTVCVHAPLTGEPAAHAAVMVRNGVMIELRALPEVTIDRATFIRVMESLKPS